jgi:hypothetical protein
MSSCDNHQPTYLTNLIEEKTGHFEFFNISENNMTTVVSKLPQGRYYHTLCLFMAAQICVHYHAIHKTKNQIHESNPCVGVSFFFFQSCDILKFDKSFQKQKEQN